MRRIALLSFFVFNLFSTAAAGWTMSDEDRLTAILSVQEQSAQSIKQLEELHRSTKSPTVALKSAYVLAQSPTKWLSLSPSFYAEFYLKNDVCHKSEDCFSLYRAAGDGNFEKLNFKKASAWYEKGIADDKLAEKDREYLVYKNAWSNLNGKNPQKAFEILNDWLLVHTTSLLREPMMMDLGRIYGEMVFEKGLKVSTEKVKFQNLQDSKNFVEGLAKSFRRLKNIQTRRERFYEVLLQEPWGIEGLQTLWNLEAFRKAPGCEVMVVEPYVPATYRKEIRWAPYLQKCAIHVSDSTKVNAADKSKLLQWMSEVSLDSMGLWGQAKLYAQLGKSTKSCEQFSQMAPQILIAQTLPNETETWVSSWLADYIKTCSQGTEAALFTKTIQEQRTQLQKNRLLGIVIESSLVAADLKLELLKTWASEERQNALGSIHVFLSQKKPDEYETFLVQLCPLTQTECKPLWWKHLDAGEVDEPSVKRVAENWDAFKEKILTDENSKKQWMTAFAVSSVDLPSSSDDFIVAAKNLRMSFHDGTEVKVSEAFGTLPVIQDLQLLQTLGKPAELDPPMSDEAMIGAIAEFQKTAGRMTKRKWSHEELKKSAQKKLSEHALFWQEQVRQRGNTPAEKKEWKQVAALIKKWEKL